MVMNNRHARPGSSTFQSTSSRAIQEIADALGTSEGTVKNHTSNIFSKLGVRDRTRAVLKALERGYV